MTPPVRVVIADDHPMFRYGLRAALEAVTEIEVVGDASDGGTLVALVDELRPHVVLTDLTMPNVGGETAIALILARFPEVAVLVLSMHADDDAVLGALRAGARGYLLKGADRDEIARAVLTVAGGGTVYGPEVGRRLSELLALRGPAVRPFPDLTPREEQVLSLVATGLGNHEIARRLGLSEKTVRNNVAATLAKLQVRDRAAAVARARDAGMRAPS
ncbi:response regulator transcription factor [Georgenia subflava]|uniref:Response regulator n=1 Tax=Georgenia subflava TaxID=1622177 RepID=A0A6N7ELP5_9MICO|nr:response regulator transcription factor [Georgenia subflava]MPV37993.1 response regulator [Georgenia subflava]